MNLVHGWFQAGTLLEPCGMKECVEIQCIYFQPDFVITCASQEESYNHALPQLLFPTPLHFQAQAACSAESLQALMQKSKMPTDQALLQTKKKTKITV